MRRYTHIVVGAGSSGSVLAARLTEDPSFDVLLIEAGPDYPSRSELPEDLANATVPSQSAHDWGITCVGTGGRTLAMPRGKVVGGSSAVNACVALRPEPTDFDAWPTAGAGSDLDWSWDSVLPYFRRLESDLDFPQHPEHGGEGPLPIRRWRRDELHPLSAAMLEAGARTGYEFTEDHNAPGTTGIGLLPMNSIDGRRISAAEAYLTPVRHRRNLTILPRRLVDRVEFDGTKAVGISTVTKGTRERFEGSTIVLSAGAFGTPGILLRSGVGATADLAPLGIPVVAGLPGVGANLSDHSQVPLGVVAVHPHDLAAPAPCIQVILRYSSSGGTNHNDMQVCLLNQVELDAFTPYLPQIAGHRDIFHLTSNLMMPEARGRVHLRGADPTENVLVDMNFCGSANDMRRHREGLTRAVSLVRSRSFATLVAGVLEEDALLGSEAELDAFITYRVQTAHHPTGTAAMGPTGDPVSVVDSHGAVLGLQNLYVADASIIPAPVRANTNLVCIMIGERIAAELLSHP